MQKEHEKPATTNNNAALADESAAPLVPLDAEAVAWFQSCVQDNRQQNHEAQKGLQTQSIPLHSTLALIAQCVSSAAQTSDDLHSYGEAGRQAALARCISLVSIAALCAETLDQTGVHTPPESFRLRGMREGELITWLQNEAAGIVGLLSCQHGAAVDFTLRHSQFHQHLLRIYTGVTHLAHHLRCRFQLWDLIPQWAPAEDAD